MWDGSHPDELLLEYFNIGYGITDTPTTAHPRIPPPTQLNSLFNKESLRRNVYLFNSLNHALELPIKTIAREHKVAAISEHYMEIIAVTHTP